MDRIYGGRLIPLDLLVRSAGASINPVIHLRRLCSPKAMVMLRCVASVPPSPVSVRNAQAWPGGWQAVRCNFAAVKSNCVLGSTSRSITSRLGRDVIIPLHLPLFRPCLGKLSWSLSSREKGHQIQKKTTGMMNVLENSTYGDRLGELGLPSLEIRRHRRF